MEMEKMARKTTYLASESSSFSPVEYGSYTSHHTSFMTNFFNGFRRDPNAHALPPSAIAADGRTYDVEGAARATATSPLQRSLKGRHLQMIAIGGSIGTGLFVSSGEALSKGGPASVLLAFILIGIMMYCTVHALGEMAVLFPVAGSFSAFSTRFLDPAWGFAMGWNYAMQWLIVLPLEIVAASIITEFWTGGSINPSAFAAIFLVIIVTINLFGVKGYGEAEFVFAIVKVVAVVGFIILGVILNCGGGQEGSYIGGKYWQNPGAFNNGFKGLSSVFILAAFAFAGTELVGLAAAETANPRKSLPTAIRQVFWRITLFYVVALAVVGLLVPYTNKQLLGASTDVTASPFTIAIANAGIQGLPSVMNVVILVAVLSVGNSSIYGSSRTLAALAEQHQAPRILAYIDRNGRPIVAIGVSSTFGLLCFFAGASTNLRNNAFGWMLALSGLSSIFTWGSICLAHIRFRSGLKAQGHTLDELAFRSQPGVAGSWVGFIFNCLVLVAQFWTAVWPVGYAEMSAGDIANSFFSAYLAAPVVIISYLGYKWCYKTSFIRSHNMDLHTGVRDLNLPELIAEERAERAAWPAWKRVYKTLC